MILLFSNFTEAQNNYYDRMWKQVKAFESEDLPKSALEIVEQIEIFAKKENNKPQQITTKPTFSKES